MAEGADQVRLGTMRERVDLATVIGLAGGFVMIAAAIAWGGSVRSFLDVPSIFIVIGGTLAVTTICFTISEVGGTAGVIGKALVRSRRNPTHAAVRVLRLSEATRKNGLLSLQKLIGDLDDEPFLQKGLSLVVDGTPAEEVESMLTRDLQATVSRHSKSAGVLRKAAEVSPAMGLIGTLIGLVQMLGNLDDPSTIGPSMAVALLTTFYGAILSNMVFAPLAAKLERNSGEEALVNQVYMMGVISIARQENPRRLEMLINSVLPPSKRIEYFD